MPEQLSENTTVVRTEQPLAADTGESNTVLMSMQQGMYYGLNQVGARIFELTEAPVSVAAVCSAVTAEFAVDPQQCERDVSFYLHQLAEQGLVELRHDTPAG